MINVIFRGGTLVGSLGDPSTWPDEYVGNTGYVKYYASWNDQYRAIQEDVTRAFGRLYKSGLACFI
jgi:hypothetical protein